MAASVLRNNNTALRLDFEKMTLSPDFSPASYVYDEVAKTFNLTETIASRRLEVMEDVVIGGKSVMPYHTPILYDRI